MEVKAAQYRKFAEECEQLAKLVQSKPQRSVLTEIADVWRKLAAQADKSA